MLALARRGIAITELRPPAAASEPAPPGPRVYVREEDISSVRRSLAERFPPGDGDWGWNTDGKGRFWIDGDAELHLEEVVRGLVTDPSTVDVQPIEDALEEDHRRWYG